MSDPRRSRLRELARAIRYVPDRILHPLRRRVARAQIGRGAPGSVLVLCLGNICRSPYAEAILRREMERVGDPCSVESAGFILPGRQPPVTALEAAADRGFDLSRHRSRAVTEEMARNAEVILVMEQRQKRKLLSSIARLDTPVLLLGDLDPGSIDRRTIPDPIDQSREVFERVFSRIDACCADLVAHAGRGRLDPDRET